MGYVGANRIMRDWYAGSVAYAPRTYRRYYSKIVRSPTAQSYACFWSPPPTLPSTLRLARASACAELVGESRHSQMGRLGVQHSLRLRTAHHAVHEVGLVVRELAALDRLADVHHDFVFEQTRQHGQSHSCCLGRQFGRSA